MPRLALVPAIVLVSCDAVDWRVRTTEPGFASHLDVYDAIARFEVHDANEHGLASFVAGASGVLIRYDIRGLTPGWHGAHLHKTGDCSDAADGFKASGGHINPTDADHGLLSPTGPELADLPNIFANGYGRAVGETFVAGLEMASLSDEDGAAIIIHENADDHLSQPIGGAGARVACGVITAIDP